MRFVEYFLEQHARAHGAAMTGAGEPLLEDQVLDGLTEEQLRRRPVPRLNSIAWLLWHLARSEDVAINVLVAGRPQVLDEDGWRDRLNLPHSAMGTGMRDDEVEDVSSRIDIAGLRAYRLAVGRRTREVVVQLRDDELDALIEPDRLLAVGAFSDTADGERRVRGYWQNRPKRFVLTATHDFQHLGEAGCIKTLLME